MAAKTQSTSDPKSASAKQRLDLRPGPHPTAIHRQSVTAKMLRASQTSVFQPEDKLQLLLRVVYNRLAALAPLLPRSQNSTLSRHHGTLQPLYHCSKVLDLAAKTSSETPTTQSRTTCEAASFNVSVSCIMLSCVLNASFTKS